MLERTGEPTLLNLHSVSRSFPKGSGEELLVLENVDLTINAGPRSAEQADRGPANRRCCASSPG